MNIVAIVGSLRKDSYNLQLAKTIQERYEGKMNVEILTLEKLPFFSEDIEQNPPEAAVDFKKKVKEADGVIIVTPEYNWSISGVLKNALDWLSRVDKVLINKCVMAAGASTSGFGTVRSQLHLRQVLSAPGLNAKCLQLAGGEVHISSAGSKFSNGRLTDEKDLQNLDTAIQKYLEFVKEESKQLIK